MSDNIEQEQLLAMEQKLTAEDNDFVKKFRRSSLPPASTLKPDKCKKLNPFGDRRKP